MRLDNLRTSLEQEGFDALLVTKPENVRYLSGFRGGEGALLVTPTQSLLLADFRYYEQVAEEAHLCELVRVEQKMKEVLRHLFIKLGVRRMGFESTHLTVAQYNEWRFAGEGVEWIPTHDIVETLRLVKDAEELERIREAVRITDAAVEHIRQFIQVGMTEKAVAWELERFMREAGAEGMAFDIIVAAGPNGAKPHCIPGTGVVENGQPIVIDLGARVDGYAADLTRTICLGEPDAEMWRVFDTVLQAQLAAEENARPGMTGQELDGFARQVIADADYGEFFGHALGHGVGLEIHEGPRASPRAAQPFQPGMLVTIEPGIYLPGRFGVRTEDLVVFTETGIEVLSAASKEFVART